ncbi:MAG: hypothetical protein QFB86_02175 [Patescibacteria group bacterium]|nr:hypothetical protein [Patescibacteria group bacterium]
MVEHDARVRFVLRSAAAVTLLLGVTMIAFPAEILGWFGNGGRNQHFAIYLGTALVGFSVINWLYSNLDDLRLIRPAIYGNLASLLPATIIDGVSLARGSISSSIWLIFIIHLIFVVAFFYCLRRIKHDLAPRPVKVIP